MSRPRSAPAGDGTQPRSAVKAGDFLKLSWKNSWRAISLGFRYPVQLIASVVLAAVAAACWGGNIAAIWPVLQVTLQGQSMLEWSEQRIEDAEGRIDTLELQIATLKQQAGQAALPAGQAHLDLGVLETQLESERNGLKSTQQLHPYIVRYMPLDPFRTVLLVMAAIVGMTLVKNLCVIGSTLFSSRVTLDVVRDLRKEFFDSVLRTDVQSFTEEGTSLMWTRFVQDIPYLSFALAAFYGRAIGEPLKIIACLALAAWINWPLLVFSLIVTPIALLLISGLSRKMKAHTIDSYAQDASTNTLVFELMQGLSTVQAYTMEQAERFKFSAAAQRCWNMGLKVVMFRALSKPAVELLGITFISAGVIAGAHLVLHRETHLFGIRISDNALEVTGLLVFLGTLIGMYDPLRKMGEVLPQIQMGLASADRLFPVLDAIPRVVDPKTPQPIARPHGQLSFEGIHFQYNRSRPVLQGIDLTIPFGEAVAIVGPNGCGKTTLANLVPRFFDPNQGRVAIDGVDIRELGLADLRRRIGLVTQQSHLFDDTVANNIRYGSPEATDEQIIAAAEQAHAHEFIIKQLANGYETMVGQAGCRLSGGQRQRIALARAILRNPEILILDEPTSQIDLQSEALIQDVLQKFVVGRTAIMITHRLSLLAVAHRVIVMQAGKIIDVGRHEELLQRCQLYRQLHQLDHDLPAKVA